MCRYTQLPGSCDPWCIGYDKYVHYSTSSGTIRRLDVGCYGRQGSDQSTTLILLMRDTCRMSAFAFINVEKCWILFSVKRGANTTSHLGALNASPDASSSCRSDKPTNLLCRIIWTAYCCHNSINSALSLHPLVFPFLPAAHQHADSPGVSLRASRM